MLFRSGFPGSVDAFCAKAKAAGYDGFEMWAPGDDKGWDEMLNAAAKHSLQYGILFGSGDADPAKNYAQFEQTLDKILTVKPLFFNGHSGRDFFPFDHNRKYVELGIRRSKATGIPVYHETHRGRIMYAAPVTRQFMEAYPDLRLTLDISHWCNVHESLLQDQADTVNMALSRTDHIHTRVGHAEGPQVSEPRAPEWAYAVKCHLEWWDKVVESKARAGQPLTMLTEFGPPDYLPALPYTRQPVADQWGINAYMKDLLRERYK